MAESLAQPHMENIYNFLDTMKTLEATEAGIDYTYFRCKLSSLYIAAYLTSEILCKVREANAES